MKASHISKKHISFRACAELKEFCHSFLNSSQADYFYYLHYEGADRLSALTLTPDCNKFVIEKNLFACDMELKPGFHYVPESKASAARYEVNQRFNLHHNLEFVENHGHISELFGFATQNPHLEIINEYFNKLEAFDRFIGEFKERAKNLIHETLKEPIQLCLPHKNTPNSNLFNKRELDVLHGLYQGYSAKETAQQLHLSPRTVESYLENIKNKLGVSKKVELMKYIIDNNLL